jgi:hypothetical protein
MARVPQSKSEGSRSSVASHRPSNECRLRLGCPTGRFPVIGARNPGWLISLRGRTRARLLRMPFGFGLGRDPYAVAPAVALPAVTISSVATSGCETMEAWEAGTSSIVAVARSAMKRCVAGGIALSSVPSRYHEGIDFHAGEECRSPRSFAIPWSTS